MTKPINVKQLRASLPAVVRRVRAGEKITVLYRSRPAFRIVPVEDAGTLVGALEDDGVAGARPADPGRHDALVRAARS